MYSLVLHPGDLARSLQDAAKVVAGSADHGEHRPIFLPRLKERSNLRVDFNVAVFIGRMGSESSSIGYEEC